MPIQKTCGHCGAEFSVSPRRSGAVKFCSIECKNASNRRTLTCASCGKSFERSAHLSSSKYCSSGCYHSASRGVAKNVSDRPRYYRTCEVCAVSFRVTFTRKDTARFCSRPCQSKSEKFRAESSERQKGEKSHRWTGGLYAARYGYIRVKGQKLSSKEFHFLHRQVIEQAMLEMEPDHPFLIEINGRKKLDPKIDVHHFDRNRSNNELSNLLAVTKYAHAQIHHRNRMPERWECWPYSHAVKMLSG